MQSHCFDDVPRVEGKETVSMVMTVTVMVIRDDTASTGREVICECSAITMDAY